MAPKKTKGRQKIEMKKIENEEDRMITFSKRRSGVVKKLSELSTLCGTDVGFIAFSGAGTPFTFGNPSFEEVAMRLMNENQQAPRDRTQVLVDATKKTEINKLNREYDELVNMLHVEEEKGKAIREAKEKERSGDQEGYWWNAPINELGGEELQGLYGTFEELYETLAKKLHARYFGPPTSSSFHMAPPMNSTGGEANLFPDQAGGSSSLFPSNNGFNEAGASSSSVPPRFGANEAGGSSSHPSGHGFGGNRF